MELDCVGRTNSLPWCMFVIKQVFENDSFSRLLFYLDKWAIYTAGTFVDGTFTVPFGRHMVRGRVIDRANCWFWPGCWPRLWILRRGVWGRIEHVESINRYRVLLIWRLCRKIENIKSKDECKRPIRTTYCITVVF